MGDKNIIKGNVENSPIGHYGDKHIHNHYNKKEVPKELTTALPRINPQELIGRTTALEQLHQQLSNNQQVVVVNGMGGLGKTALAQAYIHQYFEDYQHLAWISCNPEQEDLPTDLVSAKGLIQSLEVATQGLPIEDVFFQLLHSMKSLEQTPCLLVLDNATPALAQYFDSLPQPPNWHLLATSRSEIDNFTTHTLDFLSTSEAIALFRKYYKWTALEDPFLKQLVEELEHHTLTIEILAKMAQKFRYSKEKLQAALPSNLPAQVTTKHSGSQQKIAKITDYLCSIFEWQLQDLTPLHKKLLLNFSCLPADYHAFEVLAELLVGEGSFEPEELSAGLVELDGSGWLLRQGEGYRMHRIVREVVERLLEFTQYDTKTLIENLSIKISPRGESDNPFFITRWIPYCLASTNHIEHLTSDRDAVFFRNLASILLVMGQYRNSAKLLEEVFIYYTEYKKELSTTTIMVYAQFADIQTYNNNFEKAETLFRETIEYLNLGLPIHVEDYIKIQLSLSFLFRKTDRFHMSISILEDIIQRIQQNVHNIKEITLSRVLQELESIYQSTGNYDLALKSLKTLYSHLITVFPIYDYRITNIMSSMASILAKLNYYNEAIELYKKILETDDRYIGFGNPVTIQNYINLAICYLDIEEYQLSKSLLEKIIDSGKDLFGRDHIQTISIEGVRAMCLHGLGQLDEAKSIMNKVVKQHESLLGHYHTKTAISYSNLAFVLLDLNQKTKAISYFQKAYNIISTIYGEKHPHYLQAVYNLREAQKLPIKTKKTNK